MYRKIDQNKPSYMFPLVLATVIAIIVLLWACSQEDSPSKKAQDKYDELKENMDKEMEKLDK